MHRRPFAARAPVDAVAYGREQVFRPAAQGLFDDRIGLLSPQLGAQRPEQRHQNLSLDPRLVQERQFGINQIVVEYTYLSVSCG
jgi:hypothetical protein